MLKSSGCQSPAAEWAFNTDRFPQLVLCVSWLGGSDPTDRPVGRSILFPPLLPPSVSCTITAQLSGEGLRVSAHPAECSYQQKLTVQRFRAAHKNSLETSAMFGLFRLTFFSLFLCSSHVLSPVTYNPSLSGICAITAFLLLPADICPWS